MTARRPADRNLWIIFRWPLVLGLLSLIGLVGALLEDGLWDWLGSALLAAPVAAMVWARTLRPEGAKKKGRS